MSMSIEDQVNEMVQELGQENVHMERCGKTGELPTGKLITRAKLEFYVKNTTKDQRLKRKSFASDQELADAVRKRCKTLGKKKKANKKNDEDVEEVEREGSVVAKQDTFIDINQFSKTLQKQAEVIAMLLKREDHRIPLPAVTKGIPFLSQPCLTIACCRCTSAAKTRRR